MARVTDCRAADLFADPDFEVLCGEAAAECANPALSAPLPDCALYQALEATGATRCFRCDDEQLCGFAFAVLAPSAHNRRRYATVESLFVGAQHRSGGAGVQLMAAVEDAAREAGCEAVFYSAHVGSRLAKLLFLSTDRYVHTNHIFCRRVS
jgi:GNAT superfamily N-acetyltransferase